MNTHLKPKCLVMFFVFLSGCFSTTHHKVAPRSPVQPLGLGAGQAQSGNVIWISQPVKMPGARSGDDSSRGLFACYSGERPGAPECHLAHMVGAHQPMVWDEQPKVEENDGPGLGTFVLATMGTLLVIGLLAESDNGYYH